MVTPGSTQMPTTTVSASTFMQLPLRGPCRKMIGTGAVPGAIRSEGPVFPVPSERMATGEAGVSSILPATPLPRD